MIIKSCTLDYHDIFKRSIIKVFLKQLHKPEVCISDKIQRLNII